MPHPHLTFGGNTSVLEAGCRLPQLGHVGAGVEGSRAAALATSRQWRCVMRHFDRDCLPEVEDVLRHLVHQRPVLLAGDAGALEPVLLLQSGN